MPTPDAEAKPTRRGRKIALWTLVGLVVLVIGIRAVATTVAVRYAVSEAPNWIHGRIEIDNFDLWVLTGGAALEGVRLYLDDDPDPSPAVSLDRVYVNLLWLPLFRNKVWLHDITLSAPKVRLERDENGEFNLATLLREQEEAIAEEEIVEEEEEEGEPLEIVFNEVTIDSGEVSYAGLAVGLDFQAKDWRTSGEGEGSAQLALRESDGTIDLDLKASLADRLADLDLQWKALDLHRLAGAAGEEFAAMVQTANSEGGLRAGLAAADGDAGARVVQVSGDVALAGVHAVLKDPEDIAAKWDRLDVGIEKVSAPFDAETLELGAPIDVRLGKIALARPDLAVTREPRPAPDAEAEAPPADDAASENESNGLKLGIAAIDIEDGVVRFVDRTVKPRVELPVTDLDVAVRGFELEPMSIADLDVSAEGQGRPIEVKGSYSAEKADVRVKGDRLSMLPFDGYLQDLAQISVKAGDLSLESDYTANGAAYKAPTKIVFHGLKVSGGGEGTTFADTFGVPVGVAVALLRDQSGNIELDVPVSGTEGGTSVGVTSVVATALRGALTGALASPLKMFGAASDMLMGSGNLFEQTVVFRPGKSKLEKEAGAKLDALATLLETRPNLRAEISGGIAEADLPEVGAGPEDVEAGGTDSEVGELAGERAKAVHEYLTRAQPDVADRLEVVEWKGGLTDAGPSAQVHLSE